MLSVAQRLPLLIFCQINWMLFRAGRASFVKNWKIHVYSRKTGRVLTVKLYFNSFRHIWKTSWPTSVLQNRHEVSFWRLYTAILGVYMSRIYYDSATVNISVFIEQRNLSFQGDILLKTRRLGVLWWEKLKKTWAIADLFVMIIAWTNKKASNGHKLLSKAGHGTNLKH